MRRLTKAISVGLVLTCIGTVLAAAPGNNETPKQLLWMVKVSIPDRPDFSVAVKPLGSQEKPFGVIPLTNAGIPALAVTAEERKDDFLIRLYAAKDFKAGMKCQELRAMITEPIATLAAAKGETLTTTSFATYGLSHISLLAFEKQGPVGREVPIGCCGCGDLFCCPAKGQCLECSNCGICCKG